MSIWVVSTSTGRVLRAFLGEASANAWIKATTLDAIYPNIYNVTEVELGDTLVENTDYYLE